MADKISDYIKISEAALLIGVTTNTLRNWEKAGIIKVYRWPQNNYRLYKKEELLELVTPKEVANSL